MTSRELLASIRTKLDDHVGGASSDARWPDSELVGYLNDSAEELAAKTFVVRSIPTPVAITAGDSSVSLGGMVIACEAAVFVGEDSSRRVLDTGCTLQDLIDEGSWPSPSEGVISKIAPQDSGGVFLFDKSAVVSGALNVVVASLPTSWEDIPAKYHRRLVNGALTLCFSKPDTESFSPTSRAFHQAMWAKDIESVRQSEIRLRPKRFLYTVQP